MPLTGVRTTQSQMIVPASGATFIAPAGLDFLKVAPTALIAVLNVTFPTPVRDAQTFKMSLKNITLLNMAADPTSLATLLQALTSAVVSTYCEYTYCQADNTWNRTV